MLDAAFGWCEGRRCLRRNLAGATHVLADLGGVFSRCCMLSGQFDGALRNDYMRE